MLFWKAVTIFRGPAADLVTYYDLHPETLFYENFKVDNALFLVKYFSDLTIRAVKSAY
jgi:hypothetical protein